MPCESKKFVFLTTLSAHRTIRTSLLSLLGTTPDHAERTFTGKGNLFGFCFVFFVEIILLLSFPYYDSLSHLRLFLFRRGRLS